jgi:hypothetical protein
MSDLDVLLRELLWQARGRPFCDGCLAIELHVNRLDVKAALGNAAAPMDRGHGRCSVCGQTLTVTRVTAESGESRETGQLPGGRQGEGRHG